ncbi:MAG: hypothetical protein OK456_10380 [Thaumarchaeota archaeon]|nr:hypothetical protein [Nitrososphaerota archaeon]MDA4131735.1 hypothetical protein [Nitrososphaerota archaeon]
MDSGPTIGEVRQDLAWSNTTVALFSFSASAIVLVVSYFAFPSEGGGYGVFAEAQTVVLILLFLAVIQSVYFLLVKMNKLMVPAEATIHSIISSESTYFVAFGAVAASCVYGISALGYTSNSASALTAASILSLLFVIQLVYVAISGRHGKRK